VLSIAVLVKKYGEKGNKSLPAAEFSRYQQNYLRSGGRVSLADYLEAEPDADGKLAFRSWVAASPHASPAPPSW
jgi:hypothetical protein